MAETATGRQRLFAKALGISSADRMSRDEVSHAIDAAKSRRAGPPNAEQQSTAAGWGVDLTRAKTAGAAKDILWNAALSRVYVRVFSDASHKLTGNARSMSCASVLDQQNSRRAMQ
jgi:hypothetical protein